MHRLTFLLMAVPTLVSAQTYYDPYFGQNVRNAPVINRNTFNDGTTTTTGINPYTGQMWSNTIQPNGYTYGTTTNGQMYQDNIYQKPVDKTLNNMGIQGAQGVGYGLGSMIYDAIHGGE